MSERYDASAHVDRDGDVVRITVKAPGVVDAVLRMPIDLALKMAKQIEAQCSPAARSRHD